MWVTATRLGYYGLKRRREGDAFKLTDKKHFSERWMIPYEGEAVAEEEVEETPPPKAKPSRKGKKLKTKEQVIDESPGPVSQSDEEVI